MRKPGFESGFFIFMGWTLKGIKMITKKDKKPLSNLAVKYGSFIRNKISTRIHMSIILISVSLTGTLFSKLLLELGMYSLSVRYFFTAIACYIFFLIYIKLWLMYINPGKNSAGSTGNIDLPDIDLLDGDLPSGKSATEIIGQGGNFGGAGASSSFAGNIGMPVQAISTNSESSFSDLGGAFDVDGDALAPVLIVVAVGAIVLVILGGGMFIIYQAPSILSDAAFEALLASGFLRSTRDISSGNWIGSIIKRTWIPFGIITLVATMSGWIIGYFCPVALKLLDIQYCL